MKTITSASPNNVPAEIVASTNWSVDNYIDIAVATIAGTALLFEYIPTMCNSSLLTLGWTAAAMITTGSIITDIYHYIFSTERSHKLNERIATIATQSIYLTALIGCGYGIIPLLGNSIVLTTVVTKLAGIFAYEMLDQYILPHSYVLDKILNKKTN